MDLRLGIIHTKVNFLSPMFKVCSLFKIALCNVELVPLWILEWLQLLPSSPSIA